MNTKTTLFKINLFNRTNTLTVRFKNTKLNEKNSIDFISTLLNYLRIGMNLTDCLKIINKNKFVAEALNSDLVKGITLTDSLFERLNLDECELRVLKIGEDTGDLISSFDKLLEMKQGKRKIKEQIIKSSIYPIIVLIFLTIFMFFSVFYIIPQIYVLIKELGVTSKSITFLYNLSCVISSNKILSLILIGSNTLIAVILFKKYDLIKRIVLNKNYNLKIESDLMLNLKMLLSSGYDIEKALKIIGKESILEKIKEGKSLSESLDLEKTDRRIVEVVKIYEETGNLVEGLDNVNKFAQKDIEGSVEFTSKIMEPTLLLLTSIIMTGAVLMVIIPVMNSLTNLSGAY